MSRPVLICALAIVAVSFAACERPAPKSDLTPLVGVAGNVYCVSDADELALKSKANTDPMATWILIHHYNQCEADKNRSAQLLKMQMDRGDQVMMQSLADFNARIEMGQKLNAKAN